MSDSLRPRGLQPARLLWPWDSPGKNTGVGCHALLRGMFLTRGSTRVSCMASCIGGGFFTVRATGEAWVGGGTSGAVNQGAAPAPPRLPKAHPWVTQPFPSSGMERGFVRKKERVFPGGKLSVFQSLKISEAPVESKPAGHCSVTRWKKTAPRRGCLEAADKRRNREG